MLTSQSGVGKHVNGGRYLLGYVYRFIELCSPTLTEAFVRKAL